MTKTSNDQRTDETIDRYLAADRAAGDQHDETAGELSSAEDTAVFARCDAAIALTKRLADSVELAWAFDEARRLARTSKAPRRAGRLGHWMRSPWPAWGVAAVLAITLALGSLPGSRNDQPRMTGTQPQVTNITLAPIVVSPELTYALAELQPVAVLPNSVTVDSRSLVVLPFAGDQGATGQASVTAEAIYRQILQQLATVPGLYLIDPQRASVYSATGLPAEEIAQQLGVRGVVEGRVDSVDDGVRFELRFTDAASSELSIDEAIERPPAELALLQSDITSRVLTALTRPVPEPEPLELF